MSISCFDLWDPKDGLCYSFTHSNLPLMDIERFFPPLCFCRSAHFKTLEYWSIKPIFPPNDASFPRSEKLKCTSPQKPPVILCDRFNWASARWVSLFVHQLYHLFIARPHPPAGRKMHEWPQRDFLSVHVVFNTVQLIQRLNSTTRRASLLSQQAKYNFVYQACKLALDLGSGS